MLRVTLLDYGVGNIHSLTKALERGGARVTIQEDPVRAVEQATAMALPGVGAFGAVAAHLAPVREQLRARMDGGLPVLAVCIGMQVLFEKSEESSGIGIGLLPGTVRRLAHQRLPHIGWSAVWFRDEPIFSGVVPGTPLYFVHSFAPSLLAPRVVATAWYGGPFVAAVRHRHVWGLQFHPEKSGAAGLRIVANWIRSAGERPCS